MNRNMQAVRKFFATTLAVFAALYVVAHCHGCAPAVSAGLDVAGYTAALTVCRGEGKAAKSYAVYEQCAKEADKKYGVQP